MKIIKKSWRDLPLDADITFAAGSRWRWYRDYDNATYYIIHQMPRTVLYGDIEEIHYELPPFIAQMMSMKFQDGVDRALKQLHTIIHESPDIVDN